MPIPWQRANVPGWLQADELKDEKLVDLISKARKPILIVSKFDEFEEEIAREIIKKLADKATVVFTPWAMRHFNGIIQPDVMFGLPEITQRLTRGWIAPNGDDLPYDLIMYFGSYYYHQSQMLSALKHFLPETPRISLNRYYSPNAGYSFSNFTEKRWTITMNKVLEAL
jgi:CO dehydrogenase/acetyl-CoA synthase complex epsilon subunit